MRLTKLALTLLLLVATAPFQGGLAEQQEQQYLLIYDDGEDITARTVGADVVMHGGGGGEGCGGQAPRVTHCSTGEHPPYAVRGHGILFPLCTVALEMGSCYVGTVESVLRSSDGAERVFRVHKVTLLNKGVMHIQDPPEGQITPGLPVTHDCTSFHPRQTTLEGGLGDWSCYVLH